MICVDELRCIKNDNIHADPSNKHIQQGCYLFTDGNDIGALHTFARLIGISRETFRDDNFLPRYILNKDERKKAVLKGVKQVLFRKTVEVCRKNKSGLASMSQVKRREREKNEK